MSADKNITIKFLASGDDKLIKAFKQLATAQGKFNNTSKTTTVTTSKVNASFQTLALQVKNTVGSFKKLDVSQATINRAMKGNKVSIDKVRQALKRLDTQSGKTRKGSRLLDNTFATLRSKMLLFSFAMSIGLRQLSEFTQKAARVESMGRAFNTLSGGAEVATEAMGKLKEATNGTMSQFDLFQQANNAMILGITKNSDEMAEMFDIAQRLGNALGVDTKRAVESLVTGIGRQSRLMLDNIGIVVRTDIAYAAMAAQLGTTVDALSDVDKKQAFLTATMEAARFKVSGLGKEVLGSQSSFDRLGASIDDATVAIGNNMGAFVKLADVIATVVDWGVKNEKVVKTAIFNAGDFITKILLLQLEYFNLKVAQQQQAQQQIVIVKTNKMLIEQKEKLIGLIKQEQMLMGKPSPLLPTLTELIDKVKAKSGEVDEGFIQKALFGDIKPEEFTDSINAMNPALDAFIVKADELGKITALVSGEGEISFFENLFGGSAEVINEVTEKGIFVAQTLSNSFSGLSDSMSNSMNARLKNEMQALKTSEKYQRASNSKKKDMEKDLNDSYAKERTRVAEFEKISNIANAGINIATTLTDPKVLSNPFLFSLVAALGAAQMATIIGTPIPKYAKGGSVGGRRHSAGGTMIEAEQGEFVMSRNAVDSIGLEAMNRINSGGGGGSVSINFTGNVMSQDFIEDEAIPMIKEAIRRGADIGVA